MMVFYYYKKLGVAALMFAALVGFSRLYFFVHYPTDVLLGAVLGIATSLIVCILFNKLVLRKENNKYFESLEK